MDASEKTSLDHQIGDREIPIKCLSNGQGLELGIINQYGQLMGEYSRLDDELWFGKPDDDDIAMDASNDGLQWDFVSSCKPNVDLQKVSILVDNSIGDGGSAVAKESTSSLKDSSLEQSQTSSPLSVQNKRSYSNVRTSTIKQARSKRSRRSKCNDNFRRQSSFSQSVCNMESPLLDEIAEPVTRTKKVNDLLQSGTEKCPSNSDLKPTLKQKRPKKVVKKCSHCESTRTPQWRGGPMGRASLCNACGVQYRKGLLFPEYRPLGSPSFDPSVHSHVPMKVQQMRMSNNC